jgi:hypothetical protein
LSIGLSWRKPGHLSKHANAAAIVVSLQDSLLSLGVA